jgi:phosphoserine phosphatase
MAESLSLWNDTLARQAILDFVTRVTTPGSADFVPPPERIATFDNDGTLCCEQPLPIQVYFAIDRVKALVHQHPEWNDKEPFASLLKNDVHSALAAGERALIELVMATHIGMTTLEFEQVVKDWFATAKHPKYNKPYTECIYSPMLELLEYLRAHGFKNFIISGGGIVG